MNINASARVLAVVLAGTVLGTLALAQDSRGGITGKVMVVHSRQDRPRQAYVAVSHRGWWFYIADDDQRSKATFSLLTILFSLQSATGKGKTPLLTLPIGQ